MKIAIIGTGGVGGYFGGKLALAGFDVTFVARGEHLKKMQLNGLSVQSILGNFLIQPIKVTKSISTLENIDLILLCVKTWQVKEIASQLPPILHSKSIILPLQNGILATQELQEKIDPKHILSSVCKIFSCIKEPGIIHHFNAQPTLIFGEMNQQISSRINDLEKIFKKSNINCIPSSNIQGELWKKFIVICSSGLLAISRTTYGELRENKETRSLLIALFKEVYNLSKKENIKIKSDFVDKLMEVVDSYPPNTTNSLTRDVWAKQPSEIEHQNGTVVKLSQKHGIKSPINEFVYSCILPMEQKARSIKWKK